MSESLKDKQRRSMIARRILEIRKSKGLNQYDLAKLLECTQSLISQYESGTAKVTLDITMDMADVLGCSMDYLLGRDAQYDESGRGRLYKAFEKLSSNKQAMIVAMIETAAEMEEI